MESQTVSVGQPRKVRESQIPKFKMEVNQPLLTRNSQYKYFSSVPPEDRIKSEEENLPPLKLKKRPRGKKLSLDMNFEDLIKFVGGRKDSEKELTNKIELWHSLASTPKLTPQHLMLLDTYCTSPMVGRVYGRGALPNEKYKLRRNVRGEKSNILRKEEGNSKNSKNKRFPCKILPLPVQSKKDKLLEEMEDKLYSPPISNRPKQEQLFSLTMQNSLNPNPNIYKSKHRGENIYRTLPNCNSKSNSRSNNKNNKYLSPGRTLYKKQRISQVILESIYPTPDILDELRYHSKKFQKSLIRQKAKDLPSHARGMTSFKNIYGTGFGTNSKGSPQMDAIQNSNLSRLATTFKYHPN